MPTYITLFRYTHQGIKDIKRSPDRLADRKALESMGVQVKALYVTMGQYDIVAVAEAPDDATAAKAALTIAAQGNVTTETLRAFTEDEFRQIVDGLS